MRTLAATCNLYAAGALAICSIIALLVNYLIYRFPGINYIPQTALAAALVLLLMYLGCYFQFGSKNKITDIIKEVTSYFFVLVLLALATSAVQFTPFPPIDHYILALEKNVGINLATLVEWTAKHPNLRTLLLYSYDSLVVQLSILPLIAMVYGRYALLKEFYFFMLVTALLGFSWYYFFPTTAPASVIENAYFMEEQRATGLKFYQIHHYIPPTTIAGGMIALPSFHVIWAWICLHLVRSWSVLYKILFVLNGLLVSSCILLGWHYPIDVIGSVIIILTAKILYRYCK